MKRTLITCFCILAAHFTAHAQEANATNTTEVRTAKDTTVRLVTGLGVAKTISVNVIGDKDLVINSMFGPWNIADANLVVETETNVYIVVPLKLFRSAENREGKHVVQLANGKSLNGNLVGTIMEGPSATVLSQPGNSYPLSDCPKVELVTVDAYYASGKYSTEPRETRHSRWLAGVQDGKKSSFHVVNPILLYPYHETAGYLVGGETRVGHLLSFQIDVAGNKHTVNIDDFKRISFSGDTVTVETDEGVKTSGTIAISAPKRFVVGQLQNDSPLEVLLSARSLTLEREK
jgi:hypothetical protein